MVPLRLEFHSKKIVNARTFFLVNVTYQYNMNILNLDKTYTNSKTIDRKHHYFRTTNFIS